MLVAKTDESVSAAPARALSEQMHRLVKWTGSAGVAHVTPSQASQPVPQFQLIAWDYPPDGYHVGPDDYSS